MPSRWMDVDFSSFKQWSEQIDKAVREDAAQKLSEQVLMELANRVLRRTKQKTPVDTGHLRRNWMLGSVTRHGDYMEIEIYNNVEYAEFIEYGHRKRKGGFLQGRYMLTLSMKEIEEMAPALIGKRSEEFMKELLRL